MRGDASAFKLYPHTSLFMAACFHTRLPTHVVRTRDLQSPTELLFSLQHTRLDPKPAANAAAARHAELFSCTAVSRKARGHRARHVRHHSLHGPLSH
eukprot:358582-Chlamydomonas_euryale.AAC.9